ncbi:Uncharacterised protein r2_g3196 [Pycnogonum litorale]
MFHSFLVDEKHRDLLRFYWFKNNDPKGDVVEFRMRVHVFGNSPSPAVATYGPRKTAQDNASSFGEDARDFVNGDFYCDDGLKSVATPEQAIDLLRRTRAMLSTTNLRLHKFASNSKIVMEAFPENERAGGLCNLDFDHEDVPLQRSLGVYWDLQTDRFTFQVSSDPKPYTKRGLLSVINSLYDPLGFVQPVVIGGKILLRQITNLTGKIDWDDPLPNELLPVWENWFRSLSALDQLLIPRCYAPVNTWCYATISHGEKYMCLLMHLRRPLVLLFT